MLGWNRGSPLKVQLIAEFKIETLVMIECKNHSPNTCSAFQMCTYTKTLWGSHRSYASMINSQLWGISFTYLKFLIKRLLSLKWKQIQPSKNGSSQVLFQITEALFGYSS